MEKYSAKKIFLLDNTDKTNRYNIPLLHGVGVIVINQTFTAFVYFLRFESEELYSWALNVFRKYLVNFDINPDYPVFVTGRVLALTNAIHTNFPM